MGTATGHWRPFLRESYGKEEFVESVRMLEAEGHIKGSWAAGGLIDGAIAPPERFDQYACARLRLQGDKGACGPPAR